MVAGRISTTSASASLRFTAGRSDASLHAVARSPRRNASRSQLPGPLDRHCTNRCAHTAGGLGLTGPRDLADARRDRKTASPRGETRCAHHADHARRRPGRAAAARRCERRYLLGLLKSGCGAARRRYSRRGRDGIYCESLPCPCAKPGSGTRPPAPPPPAQQATSCGVERRAVKTLTDQGTSRVSFLAKPATIGALRLLAAPDVGRNSARLAGEFSTYRVRVRLRPRRGRHIQAQDGCSASGTAALGP